MKVKLSIIIVGLNVKEYLLSCLESIFENKPDYPFEVIYVDNGSMDGSQEVVKSIKSKVESKELRIILIENNKNLGFTKANNQGAKVAQGKYLLFLNSDTQILNGALGKMVGFLEKHFQVGVVGPKLYNSKKMDLQVTSTEKLTPLAAIFSLSFVNKYFPNNYFSRKYYLAEWDRNSIKEVEVVSGAALMIRADLFKKISGFDERYFIYFEETDLCMAVKSEGKKVVYLPEAGIIHYGGKTTQKISSEMKQIFKQSRYRFMKKHYGKFLASVIEAILRFCEFFGNNEKV